MWDEVPAFLDETFPGWETIKAEEELPYDVIMNITNVEIELNFNE